jgi:hypothetical protein
MGAATLVLSRSSRHPAAAGNFTEMQRMSFPQFALPAAILLVAALGACNDSSGNSDDGPSAELTSSVGALGHDEATAALDALTTPTLLAPLGAGDGPACATPSSAADSDGDGTPDDATYIFTAPPCRFTGYRGGTLDLVGQLRIQDPAPDSAGFGYNSTLVALRATFTPPGENPSTYSVTRNGTRALTGSVAGLQLTTDLQVVRTFTGLADAAVDEQWTVQFAPETPLQINQPLPSGTLDVAGTQGWTRGTQTLDLTVTTPTPLHYNATCTEDARRIDEGEMRAAGTFEGIIGYVRIRWTGCGKDPDVGFVPE